MTIIGKIKMKLFILLVTFLAPDHFCIMAGYEDGKNHITASIFLKGKTKQLQALFHRLINETKFEEDIMIPVITKRMTASMERLIAESKFSNYEDEAIDTAIKRAGELSDKSRKKMVN